MISKVVIDIIYFALVSTVWGFLAYYIAKAGEKYEFAKKDSKVRRLFLKYPWVYSLICFIGFLIFYYFR